MFDHFYPHFKLLAVGGLLALAGLTSCETEVDINAPYDDVTVVYGLLDQNEAFHYIKINKAFLGDGNALDFAQIRDSLEYDPSEISGVIQALDASGNVQIEYTLRDTLVTDKEDGTFFSPNQTVYYFFEPNLNQNWTYRLEVSVGQGESAKLVSAETPIIDAFSFSGPLRNGLPFSLFSGGEFREEAVVTWLPGLDGKRYLLKALYSYRDIFADGTEREHQLEWVLGSQTVARVNSTAELSVEFGTEDFYRIVGSQIPQFSDVPNLAQRIPSTCIIFHIDVAGDDLNTLIEVNEPTTSIVQDRPEFTNITNGIGIFSCRSASILSTDVSVESLNELVLSTTGFSDGLNFCDPLAPGGGCGDNICF